jgi:molybdate transport system regulatory protein
MNNNIYALILADDTRKGGEQFGATDETGASIAVSTIANILNYAGINKIFAASTLDAVSIRTQCRNENLGIAIGEKFAEGIQRITANAVTVLIIPSSYSAISVTTIKAIIEIDEMRIVAPVHMGQRGYPILGPAALLPRIKEPTIPERLEDFLKERDSRLFKIDVPDPGVVNPFVEPIIEIIPIAEPLVEKVIKPEKKAVKPKAAAKSKPKPDNKPKRTLDVLPISKPETPPPPPNETDFNDALCSRQKLWLQSESGFFGPGTYRLLELTMSTRSVKTACAEMGMSYSKAWKLLDKAEEQLGFTLIRRFQGGSHGGSAEVTERGKDVLERYNAFRYEVQAATEQIFKKYFG